MIFILLLTIGSLHASDTDNFVIDASKIDEDSIESFDDTQFVGSAEDVKVEKSQDSSNNVKSFSDLAQEIENTKKGSVLVLDGKYKFDPKEDGQYKNGIFITKSIKIVGKNNCTIDGNGKARIFKLESHCKLTLKHIKFTRGYSKGSNGGALFSYSHCVIIIKNCGFTRNVAFKANGGAIASGAHSVVDIRDSKFYYNKALRSSDKAWPKDQRGMGGVLDINIGSKLILHNSIFKENQGYLSIILVMSQTDKGTKTSTVDVKNCLFERNAAAINGVFYLDEYGKGTFTKSVFKKNFSRDKGATLVLDASKSALVKNCRFEKNVGVFGGAIDLLKYNKYVSHVSVVDCSFIKNKAKQVGGAIYSEHGRLKIVTSKFIKNKAGVSGGAVEVRGGKLNMVKPLFKQNSAQCGGAVLVKDKKGIHSYKAKFIKNRATVDGKNILAIFNHHVSKIKILTK